MRGPICRERRFAAHGLISFYLRRAAAEPGDSAFESASSGNVSNNTFQSNQVFCPWIHFSNQLNSATIFTSW